ncbi:DUF6197 family protein [Streptomyces hydrogenans]|uniref:Uncharacterized protein n=1 Tax=Streptomyces hydrogenans TaxID=1873719 RepID=A0ABQ3PJG7_9ACTN|nr:hypothetical protein [Streptomyces hydrogenans]GHG10314.1 hypothetical protein GCM10018784_23830 [Streptomyces hydrogenans]GHI25166.1 hypothetical protein Shyd_65370 [Streptomyces hydrogenans]
MRDNEIFAKAADIIESGGHCKYTLEKDGAHCAVGALCVAVGGTTGALSIADHRRVANLCREAEGYLLMGGDIRPYETVVSWNNRPERTGPQVVALFRELAGPRAADIGEEEAEVIEFEPLPETAPLPVPVPAEPVPA